MFKVRNLTTKLRLPRGVATVVDNLSFDLEKGKTLALVGESGCGKSMAALSIMRILPDPPALPPEGEVLYKGKNLLTLSEKEMRRVRGSKLAMIFQDPMAALNPVYTVGSQLIEVATLHLDLFGDEARERAIEVLADVGIPSPELRLNEYPHQLSGGMKQRVMIAMALMCEPDILIADEPTTALDVTVQAQVLDLMRRLQQERGTAILLITHDMGVVAEMADKVAVMYASKIVESGTVDEIFDHMAHPYTQGLFHSRPRLDTDHSTLPTIGGFVPPLGQLPNGCGFHPRCPHAMAECKEGCVPEVTLAHSHHVHCWLHKENV